MKQIRGELLKTINDALVHSETQLQQTELFQMSAARRQLTERSRVIDYVRKPAEGLVLTHVPAT